MAISEVQYLAMDTSTTMFLPSRWSMTSLSRKVRPSLTSVAISTILNWLCWNLEMGLPKARPFLTVPDGHVEHPFRPVNRNDAAHEPLLLELFHEHQEAAAFHPSRLLAGIRQSLK